MNKRTINFSWPATLSELSTDSVQENFSRGKLKVFYKGETADHRYFSDAFAEELIKSLPYTPVVSYYDEEKDDFVGHATEQQILGIVDPCVAPTFEECDDGNTWCVCDVVLYTERPDKVGDLAKKIVGHKQSLELDPSSVKYVINYDERKHFKNIEFTAGRFVGVSVLGTDQKPAFTGSEFFAYNEQFENKMKILREYCETKTDLNQSGGTEMNLKEFMTLSWGDISCKVDEAITKEYENDAFTYVIDMFDDCAVARFYFYMDGSSKLMRIKYSVDDNGVVTLGDINEVHIVYEDVPTVEVAMTEIGVTQTSEEESSTVSVNAEDKEDKEEDKEEETPVSEEPKEDEEEKEFKVDEEEDKDPEEDSKDDDSDSEPSDDKDEEDDKEKEDNFVETSDVVDAAENGSDAEPVEAAQVVNAEVTPEIEKVSVENETKTEETTSSSTSFTESERAEFEALKREKKVALVNSYKDDLSEETIETFMSTIDNFDEKTLETELLKAYKAEASKVKPMRAFAFAQPKNASNESSLDALVRKYKR